ncbi:MAG: Stk1 family PASTA domain-containing Ser/Thr kinase [Clostridia bacterium]|nr:Stk1 family PASTA domain-containing Ser/Thr kinase [Clostridia bacterium]
MATVYKAKDNVLNRFVAVKILRDEFTTDSDFIKRFNSEAQSAASLTHPNIVSIFDVGNEGNLYYIVMELIQGKTLKEIIVEDGKLSWKWSVNIAIQIASALETAHKNNIIHRDIKPHNIIITEEGLSKVTDFGIAKAVSNSTITAFGTTIGSVHYFSPEHARGEFTDAKSDLYSLGVVMYEMLTGRVPFDADTPVSVALKQVQEEPVDPITYNPNIPVSVNRIILKAMQKDPNLRYQNATEMIADLKMALKRPDEDFVVLAYRDDDSPTQKVPTIYEIEMAKNNERNAPKLSDKKEEPKKKSGFAKFNEFLSEHKFVKFLLGLLVLGIIFVIVALSVMLSVNKTKVKDAYIPVVVGETEETMMTESEAIEELVKAGFDKSNIKVVKESNDVVPIGYVFEQDPNDGIQHKITEKITLKVSTGPKIVKLPDQIVGRNIEEVKKELKKLGLPDPEVLEVTDEEKEKGMILAIEPEDCEGEEVEQSRVLKLTVSAGSQYEDVEMVNVVGQAEADAVAKLQDELKLVVEVKYDENTNKPDGTVLSQTIEEGKIIKEQTKVTITVNRWPEKHSATFNINVASYYPAAATPTPAPANDTTDNTTGNTTNTSTTSNSGSETVTVQIYIGNLPEHTNNSVSKTETNYTYSSNTYTGVKNVRVIVGASTVYNEDVDFSQEQTINISK